MRFLPVSAIFLVTLAYFGVKANAPESNDKNSFVEYELVVATKNGTVVCIDGVCRNQKTGDVVKNLPITKADVDNFVERFLSSIGLY